MNSNERRLKILYMLQSGKRVTSRTLMNSFGISKRTVFRDLKVIQSLGVPVTHYPESGYGVLRDGLIPPIMFNFRELSVIMMGLSFVKSQIDQEMVTDAENVAIKIRGAVPQSLQSQMNILENKTLVSPYISNVTFRNQGGDWFTICSAFVENKPVSFYYEDQYKKKSKRIIDPRLLIHYTDHWNVIGFCHDRNALRNFVLSRMNDVTIQKNSSFKSKTDYTLDELLYGRASEKIPVTIDIDKSKIFTFLTELPGKIINRSERRKSVRISFSIDNLEYINEWLLRFGNHVEVIEPDSLKLIRKSYLENLLARQD